MMQTGFVRTLEPTRVVIPRLLPSSPDQPFVPNAELLITDGFQPRLELLVILERFVGRLSEVKILHLRATLLVLPLTWRAHRGIFFVASRVGVSRGFACGQASKRAQRSLKVLGHFVMREANVGGGGGKLSTILANEKP